MCVHVAYPIVADIFRKEILDLFVCVLLDIFGIDNKL